MMPMALATVVISGREWLLPAMGFVAVAGVLLLWSYRRAPVRGPIGGICFALKLLGVLALAGCLIEPLWTGQRARPGANFFAILADNSQSMQIKDRAEKLTRGEKVREMLGEQNSGWQMKMESDFQVNTKEISALLGGAKVVFRPSALALNNFTNEWYILSSVNKLLVITDEQWKIKQVLKLDPVLFSQPEGMAFDNKQSLYISNERGQAQSATVLKFVYQNNSK